MPAGSKKITFTGAESTYTLPYWATTYVIWSPDDDFYVEEDAAVDADSFRVPANTLYSIAHGVKILHIKGVAAGGTAWLKYLYRSAHKEDVQIQDYRGGVHV